MALDVPYVDIDRRTAESVSFVQSEYDGQRENRRMEIGDTEWTRTAPNDERASSFKGKGWNINDKNFQFAPAMTKEDPWGVLLEPLLKKDAVQCGAWKEEVENLLIFAGLFSAVVTTFVVESYKTLQPDPQETMIVLLSRIADRLDNVSSTSFTTTTNQSFVQDSASIRINSFWLVSLIISLTTVLVGIIALQWLREHQAYPDLSAKQMFAVYQMRAEGIQKWYVREVFTALPLLLQGALVLFFAGMVDFSLALGRKVAIPVIVIIFFTLVFLFATTVLPTLQGFSFYLTFLYPGDGPGKDLHTHTPSPCAYKSPQSRAFRRVSRVAFVLFSSIIPRLSRFLRGLRRRAPFVRLYGFILPLSDDHDIKVHRIIPLISGIWHQETWTQYDVGWLTIRDEYAQGPSRSLIGSELYQDGWLEDLFPVYDITLGIQAALGSATLQNSQQRHENYYVRAAYHCFDELSRSAVERVKGLKEYYSGDTERHHDYFQRLIVPAVKDNKFSKINTQPLRLSEYIDADSCLDMLFPAQYATFLHYGNMMTFLTTSTTRRSGLLWDTMEAHKSELKIRAMGWVYSVGCRTQPIPDTTSPSSEKIPIGLDVGYDECNSWIGLLDSFNLSERRRGYELCWQYLSLTLNFFENTESITEGDWTLYINANHSIPALLANASSITFRIIDHIIPPVTQMHPDAQAEEMEFRVIFNRIIACIRRRIGELLHLHLFLPPTKFRSQRQHARNTNVNTRTTQNTHLLFYTAAMYLRPLANAFLWRSDHTREYVYTQLNQVLPSMARYRREVFYSYHSSYHDGTGRGSHSTANTLIEQRFRGKDVDLAVRFSPEWWNFLDTPYDADDSSSVGHTG